MLHIFLPAMKKKLFTMLVCAIHVRVSCESIHLKRGCTYNIITVLDGSQLIFIFKIITLYNFILTLLVSLLLLVALPLALCDDRTADTATYVAMQYIALPLVYQSNGKMMS